jgi:hypothetical protein
VVKGREKYAVNVPLEESWRYILFLYLRYFKFTYISYS